MIILDPFYPVPQGKERDEWKKRYRKAMKGIIFIECLPGTTSPTVPTSTSNQHSSSTSSVATVSTAISDKDDKSSASRPSIATSVTSSTIVSSNPSMRLSQVVPPSKRNRNASDSSCTANVTFACSTSDGNSSQSKKLKLSLKLQRKECTDTALPRCAARCICASKACICISRGHMISLVMESYLALSRPISPTCDEGLDFIL